VRSEGFYVNKKSTDTYWDRTSDFPICSTAPEPLCHRGPPYIYIYIYMDVSEERYAFIYADMETVGSYAACRSFVNKITALAFRKVDQYFD